MILFNLTPAYQMMRLNPKHSSLRRNSVSLIGCTPQNDKDDGALSQADKFGMDGKNY